MIEVLPKRFSPKNAKNGTIGVNHFRYCELVLMFQFLVIARYLSVWALSQRALLHANRGNLAAAINDCSRALGQCPQTRASQDLASGPLGQRLAKVVIE